MPDAIQALTSAMQGDLARLQVISHNLANVSTAAFKKQVAVAGVYNPLSNSGSVAPVATSTDFSQGLLQATGGRLDLAFEGPGFFELDSAVGSILSRNGRFHLDANNMLVNDKGAMVLGANGPITLPSTQVSINSQGEISHNDVVVDQLRMMVPSASMQMTPAGNGNFFVAGELVENGDIQAVVKQGYVEASNVDNASEMIRLIELTRHFEMSQKALTSYDAMLDASINTLAEF